MWKFALLSTVLVIATGCGQLVESGQRLATEADFAIFDNIDSRQDIRRVCREDSLAIADVISTNAKSKAMEGQTDEAINDLIKANRIRGSVYGELVTAGTARKAVEGTLGDQPDPFPSNCENLEMATVNFPPPAPDVLIELEE